MGVFTTCAVQHNSLFGPIPPTLSLTDPIVLIGHMTADTRPDVHAVKVSETDPFRNQLIIELTIEFSKKKIEVKKNPG